MALRDTPLPGPDGFSGQVRDVIDPKAFLSVSQESAEFASFLIANGKHIDYELARNVSLATLRKRPFILRGAFNNQGHSAQCPHFGFTSSSISTPWFNALSTGKIPSAGTGPRL